MDQDLHRLLYRNAELETELRLIRDQLAQAHQANTYLLGRMSIARAPCQTSRTVPTSRFIYDTVATEPPRELADLLSFDETHDSGYYDTPTLAPSVATTVNGLPITPRAHESRGRAAAKEVVEKSRVPEHVIEDLIDHGDSYTSPAETPSPQPDFKFLRNRPIKHSVGLGILNAHKSRARRSSTPDDGDSHTKIEEQEGFSITHKDGTKIWVSTADGPPARCTPKVSDDVGHIPSCELEEPQSERPQPPPTAPTGPKIPYQTPFPVQPRPKTLLAPRWAPHDNPSDYQRADPYNNHQRPGPYNNYRRPSPYSVPELFSSPSEPEERDLYRTVLIANIPTTTEIAKILAPVQGNLATVNIIKTAGMKTVPPMETDAAILTFENCVAAVRFMGKCTQEKPFEFEAEVHLARTGVSGGFGRQKWEGFPDRRPPPSTPLWLQIDAQGGFEGRGWAPAMRGESADANDGDVGGCEEEAMMREG